MNLKWNLEDLRKIDVLFERRPIEQAVYEYNFMAELSAGAQMQLHNCQLPGMILSDWQGTSHDKTRFAVEGAGAQPTVNVNFLLEGTMHSHHYAYGKDFHIHQHQHNLLFSPNPEGNHCFPKGISKAFHVSFGLDYFTRLVDFNEEQTTALLEKIARGDSFLVSREMMPIQPKMLEIIRDIRECALKGGFKKMYLEGKVLELLSLQLEQSFRPVTECPSLRKPDLDRIRQVREYLDEHFLNPASLPEIARMFGLNDFKLKKGFREQYNTTVFGYAHERRMALAQKLLNEGILNVSQVADVVGYENPNHFSAAFKKRFGYSPGVVLRQAV
jgi:AraC-like DNA-binding protein